MTFHGLQGAHTALVVDSIDESVGLFRATLGIEFMVPASIPFEVSGHGVDEVHVVRACYATDGYLELVERGAEGPFSRTPSGTVHHWGGLVADLGARTTALEAEGADIDWQLSYEGQLVAVIFSGGGAGALELVSADVPPLLEMFAETETVG